MGAFPQTALPLGEKSRRRAGAGPSLHESTRGVCGVEQPLAPSPAAGPCVTEISPCPGRGWVLAGVGCGRGRCQVASSLHFKTLKSV